MVASLYVYLTFFFTFLSYFIDCSDTSLSQLASKENMENNGWVVDAMFHNTINNVATCDPNTFYGWNANSDMAKVVTMFRGNGGAKLVVGNCWNSGFVSIVINNIVISQSRANSIDVVKFNYRKGDVLEIRTLSIQTSAIMALYSLEITDWGMLDLI